MKSEDTRADRTRGPSRGNLLCTSGEIGRDSPQEWKEQTLWRQECVLEASIARRTSCLLLLVSCKNRFERVARGREMIFLEEAITMQVLG